MQPRQRPYPDTAPDPAFSAFRAWDLIASEGFQVGRRVPVERLSPVQRHIVMKHPLALFCLLLLSLSSPAQDLKPIPVAPLRPVPPQNPAFPGGVPGIPRPGASSRDGGEPNSFTPFDLEFPGGTPAQLQDHIQGATGKPLNLIIPPEFAGAQLPPLTMKNVTVPQLFEAINLACRKVSPTVVGYLYGPGGIPNPRYEDRETAMGFRSPNAPVTDSTVWHFYRSTPPVVKEPVEAPVCRFFNLDTPLSTYKIEDLTTALQTGYKMLGETNPPAMTFHKDTKLLIAVGEPGKLKLIEAMLNELALKPRVISPALGAEPKPPPSQPPKSANNPQP